MLPSSSAQGYIVLPFQMYKESISKLFSLLVVGGLVLKGTETQIHT